jgi:hypothetical protein
MKHSSFLTRLGSWTTACAMVLLGLSVLIPAARAETTFVPQTLPNGRIGVYYEQPVSLSPTMGRVWSLTGTLPTGLTRNTASDGTSTTIKGTPTVAGTYTFVLRAAPPYSFEPGISREYTVVIAPMEFTTGAALPSAQVGAPYSQTLSYLGGTAPHNVYLVGGQLPVGLTLSSAGVISGTPLYALSHIFNVKVRDVSGDTASRDFTMTVNPASSNPIIASSSDLPRARVGVSYGADLIGTSGTSPYRWSIAFGSALPAGLTLASGTDGRIRGTPTAAGTYAFTVKLLDAADRSSTKVFNVVVDPASETGPSVDLTNRLSNLSRIGVSVHALVKLPDDGNRFTQADSAVYYIGADGRRHAFPNDRVYFTWYSNFADVRVLASGDLASIPLGANVTYRPGVKMVKFTTDLKVYAVSSGRTLRWVKTESAAQGLYGSNWNRQIDDVADTFYLDYNFGAEINSASEFNASALQSAARYVSDILPL